ncbi:hypothetical protein M413DRAFT_13936 [Hebeloma cylindrosporum]|uniref:Uncharacterized protein n=1 Tax=Hebeloma cylindrosporum TaxID=76867 RepID=A0A0C3BWF8_HEBCY|nr:hypothetical protein M413DRAFT_13936 [Hebeloma cylindrosporum h7]
MLTALTPLTLKELMPNYFDNLQDAEISGGEFSTFGGDFIGADGFRQAGSPKGKSEPVSYFANGKGLKITGGNFSTFGGDYYAPRSRLPHTPIPPRPAPVPLGPQYDDYGGYTHSYASAPQRPTMQHPAAPPPQQAPYNYHGGGYGDPNASQNAGYHYPYPNPNQPAPPAPPPGLDVPNHRPINPNPSINIWDARPGNVEQYVISDSESDSDDEHKKKKKKKKGGRSSMTGLSQQFKKVFSRIIYLQTNEWYN